MTPEDILQKGKPSEIIACLKGIVREQEQIINTLKGALASEDCRYLHVIEHWGHSLTRQESAMMGALYAAYPRAISKFDLSELLPGHDHVRERSLATINVLIHKIRKKITHINPIESGGYGTCTYRITPAYHAWLADKANQSRLPLQLTQKAA